MPAPSASVDEQLRILRTGAVDLITEADFRRKLGTGRPLRVKLGIDPTASDIHLGFAVVLRKLRQFQELGHTAVLIIGDFTAQVGDPSGKSATRPRLTKEEVETYAATYVEQASRILLEDRSRSVATPSGSAPWASRTCCASRPARPSPACSSATTSPAATRDGVAISVMEFLYPLLQGWDSVMVEADVELGGTDQLFNNLMGRTAAGAGGTGGAGACSRRRCSRGSTASRRCRSRSATSWASPSRRGSSSASSCRCPTSSCPGTSPSRPAGTPTASPRSRAPSAAGALAPVDAKRLLARTVVDLYHGDGAGGGGRGRVRPGVPCAPGARRHPRGRRADAAELRDGRIRLARVLAFAFPEAVPSNKEGRRKIEQGGVRLDGEVVTDPELQVTPAEVDGVILQMGKRTGPDCGPKQVRPVPVRPRRTRSPRTPSL